MSELGPKGDVAAASDRVCFITDKRTFLRAYE